MPSTPDADDNRYLFWSRLTAAQAHNTGRPTKAIDRRVRAFFHDVCEVISPTITLELGAHEANFSVWAKETFPQTRAIAVEANHYVYDKHRERVSDAGVEYHYLAAASTNGPVTITIPRQIGNRSLEQANRMASLVTHLQDREHESVEVEAKRMDDFVSLEPEDRVVAWIDVEGASGQVLAGSREVLSRAAAVYIEVEQVSKWEGQWLDIEVARYFHEIGKVPAIRDIQRRNQYNVVFLDAELAAREEISARAAGVLRPPRNP